MGPHFHFHPTWSCYADNRRDPAEKCLDEMGTENMNFPNLFNVLSHEPNLNLLTTYTTLMDVSTGRFEAYALHCTLPPLLARSGNLHLLTRTRTHTANYCQVPRICVQCWL